MVIAGPNGVFKKVNPTCLQLLGYSEEELIAKPFIDFVHPDDKQSTLDEMARQIKIGSSLNFENRYLRKDGSIVLLSWRASYDKNEGITYATARDITERKKAEDVLRENEKELNEAQRIGKIGNWSWDIATDKIVWSPEYYRLIGFDPTKAPPGYEEHLKAYTAESQTRLDAAVKKQMQTGEPYELDLEFANPKSTCRWITARSETIRDEKGKVIGLRGTAQDITERKKVEYAEERFKVIFENASDGMVLADVATHTFSISNTAFCRMLGYSPEEIQELGVPDLHPKEETAESLERFGRLARGELTSVRDMRMLRKDGSVFYADITASSITFEGKKYLLGVFRDATERKGAEKKEKKHLEELEKMNTLMIGRELKMIELKKENERLAKQLAQH